MGKNIFIVASVYFLLSSFAIDASAQKAGKLFQLPDSVCVGHEIVPKKVIDEAKTYSWTLCAPDLYASPNGSASATIQAVNQPNAIIAMRDQDVPYAFIINRDGSFVRLTYGAGLSEDPTDVDTVAIVNGAKGMHGVYTDQWRVFIVAEDVLGFRLMRFDFTEGLDNPPVSTNVGTISSRIRSVKELFIAQSKDEWVGFTFSEEDEMLRLRFGTRITAKPSVENLGTLNNSFSEVSDITGVVESGNWNLFVTNYGNDKITRVTMGNSLLNAPFPVDLGNLSGRVKGPVGISITKDCDTYIGYVLNRGSASLVAMKFDTSIYAIPTSANHANVADFSRPLALSGLIEDSGSLFLLAPNWTQTVSSIEFPPCDLSTIPSSDQKNPSFKYTEPGYYNVFLTVDQGLPSVQTDCKTIFVKPHPPITLSNDTLICQGDTITIFLLSQSSDSTRWSPNYNINTINGRFVKVWPDFTTQYIPTVYYDTFCVVTADPITVTVSEIRADAGRDRIISDGSSTIVGGPNTTLGEQYTYEWTPELGLLGSSGEPVAKVAPPHNMTYYLTVTNTDGCVVTDSVIVRAPCDKINLPNAFMPQSGYSSTNKFGLLNQQFVKINSFRIYDRWGREVFSTTDPQGKWDGTLDGEPAPMGVYVWEIDANCANTFDRFRQSGTVTLIR